MDIPPDEFDDDEITLVDGLPICTKCPGAVVLTVTSKLEEEFETLTCPTAGCSYGRVRVRQ